MNPSQTPGLGKLFSRSGIYLLAGAGQQAVGFLLLPVYTSVLTPADYGVLEILNTTGFIALLILNLSLPSAIMKCYHRDCESDADRKSILATSLAIGLPVVVVGCLLLLLGAGWLTNVLLGPGHPARLVRLMALTVFLNALSGMILALFRAREEAIVLGGVTLGMFVLLMFLNVYFVWVLRLGVQGVLIGNCTATTAAICVSLLLLKGRAIPHVNPALFRPLLAFGILLIPAALSGWVMAMADRYLLKSFGQLAAVGVYALGYKLGMVMDVLIVTPFQLAWPAFAFSISNGDDHRRVYARALTYLTLASSVGVLALTLLSPLVLRLAAHSDYFEAYAVVPFIALAYAFNGLHYCVSPGIHIRQQTKWLPVIVGFAAVLNIVLCISLIPRFGMIGAAWATAGSFGLLAVATFVVAQTVYPVRYEYRRLLKVAGMAVAIYAASFWLSFSHPIAQGAAAVALLAIGYPLLLLLIGFLEPDERATIGRLWRLVTASGRLNLAIGVPALSSTVDLPRRKDLDA